MFVDSDHAGDKSDRRSRTGYMIFMNMAMNNWHTKKQATVEGAVFGAEILAMNQGSANSASRPPLYAVCVAAAAMLSK